jgi:hypothetical protein
MREDFINATFRGATELGATEPAETPEREDAPAHAKSLRLRGWSPENFAREQIRGLVRQVFFASGPRPVRQVVFSAVEAETDVVNVCRRVGAALALETVGSVAVMARSPLILQNAGTLGERWSEPPKRGSVTLRQRAKRASGNLWLVPAEERNGEAVMSAALHSYLGEMRAEFEYSIVEGPAAGESQEAMAMAQFADGIILVLSAQRTRRVTARKIKERLEDAQIRLLGTVLSDRVFPVPEAIYRRL